MMIKKIIILNKKEGETPLAALRKFQAKNPKYKNVPMTYAGRLDPMASGLLIFLAGNEAKKKEKYLALPKEYEFSVLFGFATDTYDILGKVTKAGKLPRQDLASRSCLGDLIEQNLKFFTGNFVQKYPVYSSKTVNGKPLFSYAREGKEVEIPHKEVTVKKLEFLKIRKIGGKRLLQNIEKRIGKVNGPASSAGKDFRQKEILKTWRKNLSGRFSEKFHIAEFKISCGSGTYVRGIASSLGQKMNMPALAFSIKRTKIGKYSKI